MTTCATSLTPLPIAHPRRTPGRCSPRALILIRVGALGLLLVAPGATGNASAARIHLETIAGASRFPDAAEPGLFRRACAETEPELRSFFQDRGAPYHPELARSRGGRLCHIDYTPTLPGFRADPDDAPIEELFVNVESLSFLAGKREVFGDSLDVSKAMLSKLPRKIELTVGTERDLPASRYREATAFHYGDDSSAVRWRQSRASVLTNPWVQDFLKSGRVGHEGRILVTRQLFEGRAEDGAAFAPMLDSLSEPRFVRSQLSWEGGDLQFALHPLDPGQLVLFFGDSAKAYWGDSLDQDEYAYVLRREFGADLSIDLSQVAPHVDYFVAFLPADRIALVSQPVSGRRDIAAGAAAALEQRFGGYAPPTLRELTRRLEHPDALKTDRQGLERLLKRAVAEARTGWPRYEDPDLLARLARYLGARCPESPANCFDDQAVETLLASEPALLGDWLNSALRDRVESLLDLRLLSVIGGQLSGKASSAQARIDARVHELEKLGFRVVRVPRLGGHFVPEVPWSGISYVNALLVDHVLFVPRFGLGAAEQSIFDDLDRALPASYEIVPLPARHTILHNGGIHCTVATVRGRIDLQ